MATYGPYGWWFMPRPMIVTHDPWRCHMSHVICIIWLIWLYDLWLSEPIVFFLAQKNRRNSKLSKYRSSTVLWFKIIAYSRLKPYSL